MNYAEAQPALARKGSSGGDEPEPEPTPTPDPARSRNFGGWDDDWDE